MLEPAHPPPIRSSVCQVRNAPRQGRCLAETESKNLISKKGGFQPWHTNGVDLSHRRYPVPNQSARACPMFIPPLARMSASTANTGGAAARINSFKTSFVAQWPDAPESAFGFQDDVYIRWNVCVGIVQEQPCQTDQGFGMAADTDHMGFAEIPSPIPQARAIRFSGHARKRENWQFGLRITGYGPRKPWVALESAFWGIGEGLWLIDRRPYGGYPYALFETVSGACIPFIGPFLCQISRVNRKVNLMLCSNGASQQRDCDALEIFCVGINTDATEMVAGTPNSNDAVQTTHPTNHLAFTYPN